MPYKTVPKHLHGLTLAQANKWGEVFDAVRRAGGDDENAARVAWGVVRRKKAVEMKKSVIAVRVDGYTRNGHTVKPHTRMVAAKHDWIRFEDNFPEGSVTWKRLGGSEPLRKDAHAGMTLAPSKSNPAVKRWQAMDRKHSAQGHLFLTSVHIGGKLPITAAQAEKPHVKRLLAEKMIRLERNPSHHWHEYTAHITKAGREYHEAYRAAHEQTGHQESLFKGVVCIYMVRSGSSSMMKAISALSVLEKAVIPALDMVPEDMEGEASVSTWTEGPYSVTWKRGRKGHGSVTFEGGDLPMPFVMTAAGGKHARVVARDTAAMLQKGKIPHLDGVFRMTRVARPAVGAKVATRNAT